jgi:hypothetical protein
MAWLLVIFFRLHLAPLICDVDGPEKSNDIDNEDPQLQD